MSEFTEDAAVERLVTAMRQFERETGVYIPRKEQAATYVYRTAVVEILADWEARQPARVVSTGGMDEFTQEVARHPLSASIVTPRYCSNPEEHDTHIWTPPWEPMMQVRCPGRDGV